MTEYEYLVKELDVVYSHYREHDSGSSVSLDSEYLTKTLNKLGAQGWELVSVHTLPSTLEDSRSRVFYFRRVKK